MKKTYSIYYFFFLLGLVFMLATLFVIFVDIKTYIAVLIFALLLVIGLIKIALSMTDGTMEQRAKIFTECVKCKKEIDVQSDYCKHCGATQENTVVCEFCGEHNNIEDTVCKSCNAFIK